MANRELDLRLIVITDARMAAPRSVIDVTAQALEAGAPVIQLRDKHATARELFEQARQLRKLTSEFAATLIVNDRLDVAIAAGADGVHLGPSDMPVNAARRIAPDSFVIGWSTDDPERAQLAAAMGADYIGCGAVFGTASKDVGDERIGTERLRAVVAAASIPVVGIGGVDERNVSDVAAAGAAGAAVIRAVMASENVATTVTALLAPWHK